MQIPVWMICKLLLLLYIVIGREMMCYVCCGGEGVVVCDVGVIVCDDGSSLVHLFDRFKYVLVYFGWIDYVIIFFWTNIKGVFGSEYVIYYRCGGCIVYEAVTDRILVITVFAVKIVFVVDTIIFVCLLA